MASAIPSSFSYEMLSRLPANSFVLNWKEIRPDVQPRENVYKIGGASSIQDSIRFVLRGAPNEFAMNTNMYLCGTAWGNVAQSDFTTAMTAEERVDARVKGNISHNSAYHYFASSRESFNSGSLPYLDNQAPIRSHAINELRYLLTRRNKVANKGLQDLESASLGRNFFLEQYGYGTEGLFKASTPFRLLYGDATTKSIEVLSNHKFQIPLGTYSNLVNSHSVIPLGLMSSYSVNGWQIELKTESQPDRSGVVYVASTNWGGVPITIPDYKMKDLRIYVPVIKILDPSVMESILSLYEKREQVSVGGVSFPLSLRINSMGYRFQSYALQNGQQDYFFRIAGTDRSVRALAFKVYRTSVVPLSGTYSVVSTNLKSLYLTRLETHIGNDQVHDVVEDTDPTSSNIANFLSINEKRSGSTFSVLPYYQEGRKFDGCIGDDMNTINMSNFYLKSEGSAETKSAVLRRPLCQGVISFENLDRREGDYSGSYQASGKDLTNVGAIELRMRFNSMIPELLTDNTIDSMAKMDSAVKFEPVDGSDYEIVFAYSYDNVMEVSPQGVVDVTNAVL